MKKRSISQWLIIACCIILLTTVRANDYQISGVKEDILLNVQHRLDEVYNDRSTLQESSDDLRLEVAQALYPFGFFKPHISIRQDSGKTLIDVKPGKQSYITSVEVKIVGEGANNVEIRNVIHHLSIQKGQPFNNTLYEKSKEDLFNAAEHQGYLQATFDCSKIIIDPLNDNVKIMLTFNTGPRFYFGKLHFNPTYISSDLLYRYVPFKYGDAYSSEQILSLNNHLAASGYFKSVRIHPVIDTDTHVPIDIHLKPASRIHYSVGIGYGTDTGPRGRAGMLFVPVNRYGHKFNIVGQGSLKENVLQTQYTIPGKNLITDKYTISGGLSNLNYSSGYGNALLLSLAQQHILSTYQRLLSINGLTERYNYTGETKVTRSLFYPKSTFIWNKITDPLFSPSGYNVTLDSLVAHQSLLSEVSIFQAAVDGKFAFNVAALRTRFYLHAIQGLTQVDHIEQIPLSLAQLLGGADNLKGYSYKSIGPGKLLSYGGIELQKEMANKWYLIGFFDAGNVYKPQTSSFKYDTGVGLMWVSPIGPIKIGVAQAVNQRLQRQSGNSPHFVVNMGPDL